MAIAVMGAAAPNKPAKIIRAERIEIVDADGKVRAELHVTEEGPTLMLTDGNGKIRARLGTTKGNPKLVLFDANGKTRVELGTPKGHPHLLLFDAKKTRSRVSICV